MNTIGDRLKFLRNNIGKTQKLVAKELNISHQAYSNYENNNKIPSVQVLLKLSAYYKVSTDYILGNDKYGNLNIIEIHKSVELTRKEINKELDKLKDSIIK